MENRVRAVGLVDIDRYLAQRIDSLRRRAQALSGTLMIECADGERLDEMLAKVREVEEWAVGVMGK